MRLFIEQWLAGFSERSFTFLFSEFTHTALFFLCAFILFLILVRHIFEIPTRGAVNILLFGFIVILFPPIIDYAIAGSGGFWSFYAFDGLKELFLRFLTFFGKDPTIGITYGVRVEVALALLFVALYGFARAQSTRKILFMVCASYVLFFFLGTVPSWITIALVGPIKGFFSVSNIDVAQIFLSPSKIFGRELTDIVSVLNIKMSIVYSLFLTILLGSMLWVHHKEKLIAFVAHMRVAQILYHEGLLLIGMGVGILFADAVFVVHFFNILTLGVLFLAVAFSWITAIIINDFFDQETDKKTNTQRPLIRGIFTKDEYKILGTTFFFLSLLFAAVVLPQAALFLLAYHALTWLYSAQPLRLKRFPLIATFLSAIASLIIVFVGYSVITDTHSLVHFPTAIGALLVISLTLSLPLKDFKDISGDRAVGVYTVPVLFGAQWGRIIVGGGIFFSFLLSILLLHTPQLFWWATLFGGLSFWIVIFSDKKQKIIARNLLWWIFGLAFLYGVLLFLTIVGKL